MEFKLQSIYGMPLSKGGYIDAGERARLECKTGSSVCFEAGHGECDIGDLLVEVRYDKQLGIVNGRLFCFAHAPKTLREAQALDAEKRDRCNGCGAPIYHRERC